MVPSVSAKDGLSRSLPATAPRWLQRRYRPGRFERVGVSPVWEVLMKPMNLSLSAAPAAAATLAKIALLSGVAMALVPWVSLADPIEPKGTTPYVTHFIFRPLMSSTTRVWVAPRCWRRSAPRKT